MPLMVGWVTLRRSAARVTFRSDSKAFSALIRFRSKRATSTPLRPPARSGQRNQSPESLRLRAAQADDFAPRCIMSVRRPAIEPPRPLPPVLPGRRQERALLDRRRHATLGRLHLLCPAPEKVLVWFAGHI